MTDFLIAAAEETSPAPEIARLLGEIGQLRFIIKTELNAGGHHRAILLACAHLIDEKTDRLQGLGGLE